MSIGFEVSGVDVIGACRINGGKQPEKHHGAKSKYTHFTVSILWVIDPEIEGGHG